MAEMTDEARVVALDRLRPGDIADRSGELLDVVFGLSRERAREWLVPALGQIAADKRQGGQPG